VSKQASSAAMTAALAHAAIIMERGIDAVLISERARSLIPTDLAWLEEEKRQGRDSQSRKGVQTIFGFSPSKGLQVEAAGELESYLDGTIRRIPNESVCKRKIALKLLSYPVDGPDAKGRLPKSRYRAAPRVRTEAELRGLATGNAKRKAEAEPVGVIADRRR
jgi:hypothetical protein